MQENLVIVESPAKAQTIEKFLGKDFMVKSSFGHIRDLSKKDLGINLADGFAPVYEIPKDKRKVVDELTRAAKDRTVWLASDEDREGEAIAWHLTEVLGLPVEGTKRIVFHEITKRGHFGGYREPADGRHESGQRPAGAPRAGSSGRFRAVARAVEEGAAVAVGGSRAERRRAAARRARTRDHRLPVDPLFPRRGAVPCRAGQGSDALQGRAADALRVARGGRGVPPQLRRRDLHGGQGRGEARAALSRAALHDLHVAAGGGAQAGDVGNRYTYRSRSTSTSRVSSPTCVPTR